MNVDWLPWTALGWIAKCTETDMDCEDKGRLQSREVGSWYLSSKTSFFSPLHIFL